MRNYATEEFRAACTGIIAPYEENPRYLSPGALREMVEDYCELYVLFLAGKPLARRILKQELAPDREEARALSERLQRGGYRAFIDEAETTVYGFEGIGCIVRKPLTDMERLAKLCEVAAQIRHQLSG